MVVHLLEFIIVLLIVFVEKISLLENGLARTPPMGWMSWGHYMCADNCDKNPHKCLDEKLIMSVADAFYNEGYQEAGYQYIIIDDCWSERVRVDGKLVPNRKRFPRGMKFLADYIHSRGLKFGMYINIAKTTCMKYPGSRGFFAADAQAFADWDVDYIKVDGCFVEEEYLDRAYTELGYWLNRTGQPMVYSCSWPYYKKFIHKHDFDFNKAVKTCNLWRDFHDIFPKWGNVVWIVKYFALYSSSFQETHGPGHWHDPDMLITGTNSLTPGQNRVHMCVWAMLSAPLIISCDMARVPPYEKKLLLNLNLIAIAQDAHGIMAAAHKLSEFVTLWVKPHNPMKGDRFFSYTYAVVNLGRTKFKYSFEPSKFGLDSGLEYAVLDVFAEDMKRNITYDETFNGVLSREDVHMFTLYPL